MFTAIFSKAKQGVKNIAAGKGQANLGIQSPHLAPAIVRVGRFLYSVSLGWIFVSWYSGYVNERTDPGGGPKLILPGKPRINSPDRANPSKLTISSGGSNSGNGNNSGGPAGPSGLTGLTNVPQGKQGAVRLAIARAAVSQVGRPGYIYREVRPMPVSLNTRPFVGDCSGFATDCYKYAKAPDPNGLGYNGQGFTGTLEAKGVKVDSPVIGDLAFWSSPDHVAVVVSTGKDPGIVEFGGGTTPIRSTISQETPAHARFLGYRSYL